MYYLCSFDTDDEVYIISGLVITKNNHLLVNDSKTINLCKTVFDGEYWKLKTPRFAKGFKKNPEDFFRYINELFGNQVTLYLNDDEIKKSRVQYLPDWNKSVKAIFNLDTMKYEIY